MNVQMLAEKIGIHKTTLYRKIKGEVKFYTRDVYAIAKVLNLTTDDINAIFFPDFNQEEGDADAKSKPL